MPSSGASSRYQYWLWLVILTSGILSYLMQQPGHDWGGDYALYVNQAERLIDGNIDKLRERNTYAMLNSSPETGPSLRIGPFLYPWGFPLLIAPVYALGGENIPAMKGIGVLFLMLSLGVTYALFRPELGPARALAITALMAFCPPLLLLTDTIGSDVPFHFFALWSMLFIQKTLTRRYWINATVTTVLTGLIIGFAFLIRTNGLFLLGALFFSQFVKYRTQLASPITFFRRYPQELWPYLSFGLGVMLIGLVLPEGSGSHFDFFSRLTPGKLAYNLMYYFRLPADFFSATLFPKILYGISFPFLLLGVYRRFRQDHHYLFYIVFSLVLFVVWPPVQGLRFIISLVPFYLYFVFRGLAHAEQLYRKATEAPSLTGQRLTQAFSVIVLVQFLISASLVAVAHARTAESVDGPYTATSQEVLEYIRQQTPADAAVIFFKPRVMDLMTNRLALRVFNYDEIIEGKGDFLVYRKGQDFGQITLEEVGRLRQRLPTVLENEDFVVVDLRPLR